MDLPSDTQQTIPTEGAPLAVVGPFEPDDDFVDENVLVDEEVFVHSFPAQRSGMANGVGATSSGSEGLDPPPAADSHILSAVAMQRRQGSSSSSTGELYVPYRGAPQISQPYAYTGMSSATATVDHPSPLVAGASAVAPLSVRDARCGRLTSLHSPSVDSPISAVGSSPIGRSRHHFDCFGDMLENPFLSDVTLRTKDGREIPAHRVVLAAVSFTFRTMLSEEEHCRDNSPRPVIDVPYSYTEGGFKLVLQYMYTGAISGFESTMAVSLLEASSYFQLDELKTLAVKALCASTTEENVFERLDLALSFSCAGLREHSLMIIRQYNTEVIHSRDWLTLPLDVALLLVQETVIEGELTILQRCYEWCCANVPTRVEETLVKFLRFVDFTAMTEAEVSVVESMQCVPVSILYDAFKRSVLGLTSSHIPRNGGIVLQWEMKADQMDVEVVNNHVTKISSDYIPRTVCAINKFSRGRHYWTVSVMDLRLPHDSFVGVMFRPRGGSSIARDGPSPLSPPSDASIFSTSAEPISFVFEPCCMAVRAPEGCEIVKEAAANPSILIERWCEVGVLIDFTDNCMKWFNHKTKALLFTLRCPGGGPLPSPLYPCVTLIHKSNGGAMLSECTTFQAQRPPRGGFAGPTSVTPIKTGVRGGNGLSTSAILAAGGSPHSTPYQSRASPHAGSLIAGAGLASVPPIARSRPSSLGAGGGVFVASGVL